MFVWILNVISICYGVNTGTETKSKNYVHCRFDKKEIPLAEKKEIKEKIMLCRNVIKMSTCGFHHSHTEREKNPTLSLIKVPSVSRTFQMELPTTKKSEEKVRIVISFNDLHNLMRCVHTMWKMNENMKNDISLEFGNVKFVMYWTISKIYHAKNYAEHKQQQQQQ